MPEMEFARKFLRCYLATQSKSSLACLLTGISDRAHTPCGAIAKAPGCYFNCGCDLAADGRRRLMPGASLMVLAGWRCSRDGGILNDVRAIRRNAHAHLGGGG